MIERYTRPEMGALWTDRARWQSWLDVELAVCEALAARGAIPADAMAAIRERAAFDPARILAIESEVGHDVIAFVTSVAEAVGPAARFVHYGLTSSDVVDTAQALRLVRAADLLLADLEALERVLERRAREHRRTLMVGRTHGIHAEPYTLGLKFASWYAESGRNRRRLLAAREEIRCGKISGAVGTYAHLGPEIEADALARLGLAVEPIATQVIPRDRHAAFVAALAVLASSLDRIATEIRHLQRSDVREVEEPFGSRQKGSSSMPHKRNPVGCENVSGLARLVRSHVAAALENVVLWHERDISHSSVERVILPDATILCDYMLARMTRILDGLLVYPERMRQNMEITRGLIFSQAVLLALTEAGLARDAAYAIVQRQAMRTWAGEGSFEDLLGADPEVRATLGEESLRACFDPERYLRHVDAVFDRVFADLVLMRRMSDRAALAISRPSAVVDAAMVVAGSWVMAALAQIYLPLPFTPIPITGQTLGVLLVGAALGARRGTASMVLYLAQGALGLPFFAGGTAGLVVLAGPTAGYLIGCLPAVWLVGRLTERGFDRRFGTAVLAFLAGEAVVYLFGVPWLARFVGPERALVAGFWPFLPGTIVKAAVAGTALYSFRAARKR